MTQSHLDFFTILGKGLAAGLTGTGAMMAMRAFDSNYAPKTIARAKEDPGAFLVHAVKRVTRTDGELPPIVEQAAALGTHLSYGALFGVLYGLWRHPGERRSSLSDGVILGSAVYAFGYGLWLPLVGLTRPLWKQRFPEIAGEMVRHLAFGVATAAAYGAVDSHLAD